MNAQRRKALADLMDRITKLGKDRDDIKNELETLRDEEQESFDNMPEGLQQGDRGQAMEEAIGELEEAISALEEFDTDSINGSIDNARGQ